MTACLNTSVHAKGASEAVKIMARCPKCGKEVGEGFKYCPYCGAELSVDVKVIELELEELRHKEKVALVMIGMGIAVGMFACWLVEVTSYSYAFIPILIALCGLGFIIVGGVAGVYYSFKREKLMKSLKK